MKPQSIKGRGFTLHVALFSIMMLGLVLLISTQLFRQLDRQWESSSEIDDSATQAYAFTETFWLDVWQANSMRAENSALYLEVRGMQIEWRIDGDVVVRKSAEGERQLARGPITRFAIADNRVELWMGDSKMIFANLIQESHR